MSHEVECEICGEEIIQPGPEFNGSDYCVRHGVDEIQEYIESQKEKSRKDDAEVSDQ